MISKKLVKYYRSLALGKYRKQYKRFMISGDKACRDLILSNKIEIKSVIATEKWLNLYQNITVDIGDIQIASLDEIKYISKMKSPPLVIVEAAIPNYASISDLSSQGLYFYHDGIQDPGNLGTMIRTSAWFGIKYIILSENCVNPYSSKVVQASMAAVAYVEFIQATLSQIKDIHPEFQIAGADMLGAPLTREVAIKKPNIIVIGQEGQGISAENRDLLDLSIAIPGKTENNVDSLNAAIAMSILAFYFSRVYIYLFLMITCLPDAGGELTMII